MKTLLALINDPVSSEGFISYATSMAKDLNYNIHLIYIQNPALYTLSSGTAAATSQPVGTELDVEQLEIERKNVLKSIKEKLHNLKHEISPDVSVDVSIETGSMDVIVNQYIEDGKADMVIQENQDEGGFWFLDSTSTNLVIKAKCPGWLIPPDIKYKPLKKIVFATDYNEADIITIKNLLDITRQLSPEIIALHITDSGDFEEKAKKTGYRDTIIEKTNYDKITIKSIIENKDEDMEDIINDYAVNANANLIVLLKQNHSFFDKLLKSSSTKKVIKKTRLPVLVFHEKEMNK